MKLNDFIRMQNRELVESANISFKLLLPLRYGGKWFFYCENGDTVEGLCKFVEENNINIPIVWPYNKVAIEEEGEDDKGNLIFKYIFDFNDFPENLDLMSYQ